MTELEERADRDLDTIARASLWVSGIVGLGSGFLASHWLRAMACVGVGLLAALVAMVVSVCLGSIIATAAEKERVARFGSCRCGEDHDEDDHE